MERAEETIMGPTETKAKRVDILGGLSWEALKQVVRKDDIDRSSDKYDRGNKRDIMYKYQNNRDEYRKPSREGFRFKSERSMIPKFKRRFQPKEQLQAASKENSKYGPGKGRRKVIRKQVNSMAESHVLNAGVIIINLIVL